MLWTEGVGKEVFSRADCLPGDPVFWRMGLVQVLIWHRLPDHTKKASVHHQLLTVLKLLDPKKRENAVVKTQVMATEEQVLPNPGKLHL